MNNNRKFVKVYAKAYSEDRSSKWVAEQLGMTTPSVYVRANSLRKRGVNLPLLTRATSDDSVEALNDLLNKSLER